MSKNINIDNETKTFMEDEIKNILSNITETDYKSFKENDDKREIIIDKIFSDFMNYEININNKKIAKELLKDYEFVEMEDIKTGYYLKYFNLKAFYNLKLIDAGVVLNIYDNGYMLVNKNGRYNSLKPNFFFKKINKDTLVKMKLLDIVNNV